MKTTLLLRGILYLKETGLRIICISLYFLAFACAPVDDNPEEVLPPNENPVEQTVNLFNLSTTSLNVVPQRIIKISSNNMVFSNENYEGKFGDVEIELIRDPEGNLVFAVPTMEPGTYTLKLTTNGKEGKIDIKINANNITDVNATLKTELETPLMALNKNIEILKSEANLSSNTLKELNSALKMYNEFSSKLSTLSNEEKKSIAGFFKANPILSSNLSENYINSFRESAQEFECFNKNALSFTTSSKLVNDWEELAVVLKGTNAEGMVSAGVGAYVAAYLASALITASQEKLTTTCKRPVATQLLGEDGNTNTLKLVNNVASDYKVKNTVRSLVASDVNDTNENVSKVVQEINNLNDSWNGLMSYLNPVLSVNSNWFNQWFPNQNNFEPISKESLDVPTSADESIVEGNSQAISITNLPSGIGFILEKNESNILKITLQANPSQLPLDVTGKIVYNNEDFNIENNFAASLSVAQYNYKLEIGHVTLDNKVVTDKIISYNDKVTLPNNVSQWIRFTVDGEPVDLGGVLGAGWYLLHFGDFVGNPILTNDVYIEGYDEEIRLPDMVHGGIIVRFKIDLTLSNEAYRSILNHTYRIAEYNDGYMRHNYAIDIKFREGGKFSVSSINGNGTGTYQFFIGGENTANLQCENYIMDQEIIGYIQVGGIDNMPSSTYLPNLIVIQKDGTVREIGRPYGCAESNSGWLIEKIN